MYVRALQTNTDAMCAAISLEMFLRDLNSFPLSKHVYLNWKESLLFEVNDSQKCSHKRSCVRYKIDSSGNLKSLIKVLDTLKAIKILLNIEALKKRKKAISSTWDVVILHAMLFSKNLKNKKNLTLKLKKKEIRNLNAYKTEHFLKK